MVKVKENVIFYNIRLGNSRGFVFNLLFKALQLRKKVEYWYGYLILM